jgi:hypothetical protein
MNDALPGLYPMGPPLWPERVMYRWGEVPETVEILERWIMGARVHPYGSTSQEQYGWEAAYRNPPHLDLRGVNDGDGTRWTVSGWRRGHTTGEQSGRFFCSGYSHPADACYSALTLIEEEEREKWEAALVLGVA